MKSRKNDHLIPIEAIINKGKWDEYCKLSNKSAVLQKAIKNNPERYEGVCVIMSETIADKLGFIWKI